MDSGPTKLLLDKVTLVETAPLLEITLVVAVVEQVSAGSNGASNVGGPGGNGKSIPEFAAPLVSPIVPSPYTSTGWTPVVGPGGVYGGGGGGGEEGGEGGNGGTGGGGHGQGGHSVELMVQME